MPPAATIMTTTILGRKRTDAESEEEKGMGLMAALQRWRRRSNAGDKAIAEETAAEQACKIGGMALESTLYFTFVVVFQLLTGTIRVSEEFTFDKVLEDRIVENHFDSSHNTFESIRRIPDVYEWGNQVLWPGLLGDLGPCHDLVGSMAQPKTCADEAWPDGDGSFALDGARHFSVAELVERMDNVDWTEGVMIRVGRVAPATCETTPTLGTCYPEVGRPPPASGGHVATDAYGFNWTHPSMPPYHPFTFLTTDELGANPAGVKSAAFASLREYESSGYVALVLPFFSDTYLPPQSGTADDVADYRNTYVNTTNGRIPRYYCVRLSPNGRHLKQLCDPGANGDGTGAPTGAVRAAVETLWNDLKRGHFIDHRARVMTITLQLRNNHMGVRYRMTLMIEFSALGSVFTSYDVETRPLSTQLVSDMRTYAMVGLLMVLLFASTECITLVRLGLRKYAIDLWNWIDWVNYIMYIVTWLQMEAVFAALQETPSTGGCTSFACSDLGYFDDWKVMSRFRDMKLYLSLNVCIQLFKVLKFVSRLVPKMSLSTNVLKACALDMVFFMVTFAISMLAFSMMLYVQLGNTMNGYYSNLASIFSLCRALFGDFDVEEILDNSPSYLNAFLFLTYLFVAIFIMLSMFLAILAEAQTVVREEEAEQEKAGRWGSASWSDEYGVISATGRLIHRQLPRSRPRVGPPMDEQSNPSRSSPPEDVGKVDAKPQGAPPSVKDIARFAGAPFAAAVGDEVRPLLSEDVLQQLAARISEPLMQEIHALRAELQTSQTRLQEVTQ